MVMASGASEVGVLGTFCVFIRDRVNSATEVGLNSRVVEARCTTNIAYADKPQILIHVCHIDYYYIFLTCIYCL